jgi:hypothetical protein
MRRALAVALMALTAASARGQGGFLLQGIFAVEGWKTDTTSTMLARNGGDPAGLYRLRLWTAIEPARGLFVFANGLAEGGNARRFDGPGTTVILEQGGIRFARHRALVLDAGRMIHPIGASGSRLLATRNPLIGIPDAYLPVYPLGVMASGEKGKLDYRAALVSLPPTHRDYVPDPDPAPHPVVGIGVTPIVGFRVGVTGTAGPYLNKDLSASELDGREWSSYRQRVMAADVQYGFGHFDLRGEFALSEFEVPRSGRIDGPAGYVEARATLTPRVFVAGRGEFNRYPFIRPISATTWISRRTELRAFEGGVGFRFDERTLLKASFTVDDWVVTPENATFVKPGGKAIAVQVSRAFDVAEWLARR